MDELETKPKDGGGMLTLDVPDKNLLAMTLQVPSTSNKKGYKDDVDEKKSSKSRSAGKKKDGSDSDRSKSKSKSKRK